MENVAKALMIAGGALLAMLLGSLFVYVFRTMGQSTSNMYSIMDEAHITSFNQQFLNYNNNTNLKPQEAITLVNLAKDSNENRNFNTDTIIVRLVPSKEQFKSFKQAKKDNPSYDITSWWIHDKNVEEEINIIDDVLNNHTYTCEIFTDINTKLVSSVNLIKNW